MLRRSDLDRALIEEEKSSVANRMINDIKKHPERASALIAQAATQMELVEKQRHGYDPVAVVNAIDHTYERADRNENRIGLYTGFKLFDERMRGVPKFEKFISMPGKPNHAKSTVCDNLGWRLATLNSHDVMVLFHTADDSLYERHSRIISSYFHLPSELFEVPDYYLKRPEEAARLGCPNFEQVLPKARWWFRELAESERLVVADINLIAPTFPALRRWVADMRKRFPDKYIIVLEDNFHLLELPGYDAGEAKIAAGSHFIKQMCNNFQVTVIASMEITKADLAPGKRPVMSNLKGSSAIPYDINANWGAYNDLADLMDESQIYWDDDKDMEATIGPGGEETQAPKRKPIVELHVDKNKISGFKGTTFFRMWPESGRMEECSLSEAAAYVHLISSRRAHKRTHIGAAR